MIFQMAAITIDILFEFLGSNYLEKSIVHAHFVESSMSLKKSKFDDTYFKSIGQTLCLQGKKKSFD